jgi:hypothetical protein
MCKTIVIIMPLHALKHIDHMLFSSIIMTKIIGHPPQVPAQVASPVGSSGRSTPWWWSIWLVTHGLVTLGGGAALGAVRHRGSAYNGDDFFGAGVHDLLARRCFSLHGGGGGMRHGSVRRPPCVVAKMVHNNNGLLGGGWLVMAYCIGGRVPSSTLLAMLEGSHGEPWWHAGTVGWRLVNPHVWVGWDPKMHRTKALLNHYRCHQCRHLQLPIPC